MESQAEPVLGPPGSVPVGAHYGQGLMAAHYGQGPPPTAGDPYNSSTPGYNSAAAFGAPAAGAAMLRTVAVDRDAEAGNLDLGSSFDEKAIRLGFVKKVFSILALQLILTAGIMCIIIFVDDIRKYCQENSWPYIASTCVYFVLILVLACVGDVRRRFPINLICLLAITLAMGVMLGTIASYYEGSEEELLMAVGITTVICIAMIGLGLQQKFDFTWMTGGLVIASLCLICFGIMAAIFNSSVLSCLYAAIGAFLFSLWLLVDVQLIMGGKNKMAIDPEEYILAALNIYLDMINIFLFILMLLSNN